MKVYVSGKWEVYFRAHFPIINLIWLLYNKFGKQKRGGKSTYIFIILT